MEKIRTAWWRLVFRQTGVLNIRITKVWKAAHGRLHEFIEAEDAEYEMVSD